jgi:hypothetical protein
MTRRLSLLIGLASLGAGSALSDIVNVAVSGAASGSGSLTVACALSTAGCVHLPDVGDFLTVQYSFTGTSGAVANTFTTSGSGTTLAATGIDFPYPAQAQGFAGQQTSFTADSLDINLTGGHSAFFAPFYGGSEQAGVIVSFDLTEESLLQLTGDFGSVDVSSELLDSRGNVILKNPFPNSSTVLPPGSYQLDASASGGSSGAFGMNSDVVDFNTSLDAVFTPVTVPEPRETFVGVLFGAMLGGYVFSRLPRAL